MLCIHVYKVANQILSAKTAPFSQSFIVAYVIGIYNLKKEPATNWGEYDKKKKSKCENNV